MLYYRFSVFTIKFFGGVEEYTMGLLWVDYEEEFQNLVETAYRLQVESEPEYFSSLSKKVQQIIYRDTRYNVDFLYTAYVMQDSKIMTDYAIWLYELMASILRRLYTAEEMKPYVMGHLGYIRKAIPLVVSAEKQQALDQLLADSQEAIRQYRKEERQTAPSPYEKEISLYMQSLFDKKMRQSMYLMQRFLKEGIPINDIYTKIMAESMRRVGELWHTAKIGVDLEHYCTSATQMAMAELYPVIFATERKDKQLLCACPGRELHEMGARMLTDVFENAGWDTTYLGAAVPVDSILASIRDNPPDLVAFSVTMPQHLMDCKVLVETVRQKFPSVKIAVGGRAFQSTHHIWKKWPIDFYGENAVQLLEQVNR